MSVWSAQRLLDVFHLSVFIFALIILVILLLGRIYFSEHQERQKETDEATKYKENLESQEPEKIYTQMYVYYVGKNSLNAL